jgi:hypothetical protein
MTGGILPFERLFSMPAFEALRSLRRHLLNNHDIGVAEARQLVLKVELDSTGFDMDASEALLQLVPVNTPNDGVGFYRGCIRSVLVNYQPIWARSILQGRQLFYQTLERDEQSLFRQTGILDDPPGDDFVEWWDDLTGEMRLVIDLAKLRQGRAAERRTLEYERRTLAALGIDRRVEWVGFDDNTKGFDVLSYKLAIDGTVVPKLVEVKSTIASPLRFRVTRNEWEQARKFGDAYVFQIWDMTKDTAEPFVRTVDQVRPHIPTDNEKGKWKDAEIPVGING